MARPRTAEHGTNAGYQQHRRNDEDACDACLEAHRVYGLADRARNGAVTRGPVQPHGTRGAYERERRAHAAGNGPEPCDACRAANRQRGATTAASGAATA